MLTNVCSMTFERRFTFFYKMFYVDFEKWSNTERKQRMVVYIVTSTQ